MSTSGLRINGKRRGRFLGHGLRPGVPAGWSGREQGRFHGSGFASGASRDQAMDKEDADVRRRIRAGVRESPRTDAGDGDRGTPAPPRRGAVYVDEAIWEWRGLKWAHLLADDTDDLHRFAATLGIDRTSYQGPPRTSVPH